MRRRAPCPEKVRPSRSGQAHGTPPVAALVDELLDAHADTVELAVQLAGDDPRWGAHLDYLRALQRVGKAALAHGAIDDAA